MILAQAYFAFIIAVNIEGQSRPKEAIMPKDARRGRPPKTAGEAKRAQFNTRLRPSLKEALEAAARANGRSASEEIEVRLEQSVALQTLIGSQEGLLPAIAFSLAGQRAAEVSGHPVAEWRSDQYCFEEGMLALLEVLCRQLPVSGWPARRHFLQRAIGRLAAPYKKTLTGKDLTIKPSTVDLYTAAES